MSSRPLLLAAALAVLSLPLSAAADEVAFASCLAKLRGEAAAKGVRGETFDTHTVALAPDMAVIGFLDAQPEFVTPIWDYLAALVDEERVADGRAMLTLGELQEAEKSIVLSLGVPLEFLTGGLGQTRGEITLRMIENQLRTHIENLNGLIQWVERRAATFLGWASIKTSLADFKMIDDLDNKALKMQMWQQGQVSHTTMADAIDVDLTHERKQRKQDALDDARAQSETELAVQKEQSSLSLTSRQRALQNQGGIAYDPQQVLAANVPLAQELGGMDEPTRRSRLDSLQGEDPVSYAVVKMLLEQQQQNQTAAMKQQGMA